MEHFHPAKGVGRGGNGDRLSGVCTSKAAQQTSSKGGGCAIATRAKDAQSPRCRCGGARRGGWGMDVVVVRA